MSGPVAWTDKRRLTCWLGRVTVSETGCWLWRGHIDSNGYGRGVTPRRSDRTRKIVFVHRFVYEQLVSEIPADRVLHHLCGTKRCVNPTHLVPLTRAEHLEEHPRSARIVTHCLRGHAFDEANTYVATNGHRFCRACGRERANRLWAEGRYARQKKAA